MATSFVLPTPVIYQDMFGTQPAPTSMLVDVELIDDTIKFKQDVE